jgi:hypothetical protein
VDRRLFAVPPLPWLLALAVVGSGAQATAPGSYLFYGRHSNRTLLRRYLALAKLG